jgi:hypothetical protein
VTFHHVRPPTIAQFQHDVRNQRVSLHGFAFFGHGEVKVANGKGTRTESEGKKSKGFLLFTREERGTLTSVLMEDPIDGEVVSAALGKGMTFAYIFGCDSASVEPDVEFENTIAGALLCRTWLSFVIAVQTEVDFFAANAFFQAAVNEMIDGAPLDLAVAAARGAVYARSGIERFDWWVPVLYAQSSQLDLFPPEDAIRLPPLAGRDELQPLGAVRPRDLTFRGIFEAGRGALRRYFLQSGEGASGSSWS